MTKQPAIYILASRRNKQPAKTCMGTQNDLIEGFTKQYKVHRLVYYELHGDMVSAITREKQMKNWNRAWKLQLIESQNPNWKDLWDGII
jgi:putative endonuclease